MRRFYFGRWLNSFVEDTPIEIFGENYKLRNFIKKPTCLKNLENPTYTDLLLTNKLLSFKNTYVIETGLSDFYTMIVAVMKTNFLKWNHRLLVTRNMRIFKTKLS